MAYASSPATTSYAPTQGRGIGIPDISGVYTTLGVPWTGTTNQLPSVTTEAQLGEIVTAWDTTANTATVGGGGYGEFIMLAVPISTTIVAGTLYYWTPSDYKVVIVPASVSTTVSGSNICVAVNGVTSNASTVQYTWFQITGRTTVLKTAVQVLPNVPVYVAATAGRVKVLLSTFRSILGARTANATTVTSTTSTVALYINRPCIQPSQ
jgi:hypothetical protein